MAAPDSTDYQRGQLAYDTYCASVGGVAFNGDQLPPFEDTPDRVRDGWVAASVAVAAAVLTERLPDGCCQSDED
jgi:hypothetical protein